MLTTAPLSENRLAQLKNIPVHWVKTQEQLFDVMDRIDECDILALDTEFIKRDTFYPKLALVQVNTGDNIYLIDTPRLDMDEFWEVIAEVPTLVLHACGEDLGIYYLLSNLPTLTNIFDTQIGLSYLTGELQSGYQKALSEVIAINVDKGESQSNWLQRPLTHEQEIYAADDVRYLLALYDELKQQLNAQNLWHYAVEDSQNYAKELYESSKVSDENLYLSVADFRDSPEQLAMLQALCEWREKLAKSTNQPRTFILRPQALREIIEKPPHSLKQLGFTSTKPEVIRMYGQEILSIISDIKKADPTGYPKALPLPYRNLAGNLQQQIEHAISEQSHATQVQETVLMRKKWLSELYAFAVTQNKKLAENVAVAGSDLEILEETHTGEETSAEEVSLSAWLTGWRHDWIMTKIVPILQTTPDPIMIELPKSKAPLSEMTMTEITISAKS